MLTKSKFMQGLQCHRLLWFSDKKRLPEPSIADLHKFEQGYLFEKEVHKLYPDAINLKNLEFKENIKQTEEAIKNKKTILEAGFNLNELYVRSDILEPDNQNWNLYEIKATSEVKPQHLPDLAFQKYLLEKLNIKINKCFIIHLNKEYIKNGEINPKELIIKEDVTEKVEELISIEDNVTQFLEILNKENEPDISISVNCNKPYPCPLKEHCWGILPTNNVLHLTNWRQYWEFFHQGITDIKKLPKDKLNEKDSIIYKAVTQSIIVVNKEHIRHFLNPLQYPLYHFDFETFDTAVPIYDKSRPYQKIPFQYSLHVEQKDGSLNHFEYLALGDEDPRIKLLEQLKNAIGSSGSVIVYNQAFEISVLKKLSEDFPEHKEWILNVIERVVDLIIPFREFHYYNPLQKGSYSIKRVLPAITNKSYDNLEINNGGDASILYFNNHIKDKLEVNNELRQNLLNYCCLDTEAMVMIIDELENLCGD